MAEQLALVDLEMGAEAEGMDHHCPIAAEIGAHGGSECPHDRGMAVDAVEAAVLARAFQVCGDVLGRRPEHRRGIRGRPQPAILLDEGGPRDAEHRMRIAAQREDVVADEIRVPVIVSSGEHEVGALRMLEDEGEVPHRPAIDRLADVADARLAQGIAADDVAGAVGRGVVGDDQGEAAEGLQEQRIQRLGDGVPGIVYRHPDHQRGARRIPGFPHRASCASSRQAMPVRMTSVQAAENVRPVIALASPRRGSPSAGWVRRRSSGRALPPSPTACRRSPELRPR